MTLPPRQKAFKLTERLDQPLDLYNHLPYRVAVISNLLMLDRDIAIRSSADLAPRELRVLLNIGSYMPITSADVAYQTRIDSYTVSRAVSTLKKKGYLIFEPAENNRRVKLLALTEKGIEVYRQLCNQIDQRADKLSCVLNQAEQAELFRMLALIEDRAEHLLANQAKDLQLAGETLPADQKELIRWRKKSARLLTEE
ncbi:MAG: MarR family transcriptional regulator [Oceanospirillum sp.]|nr:MarR family transcriptional regulator [Oceanospirillum sp.]